MVQTIQEQTTYEDTNLEKRYVVKSGSRLSPNALNVEGYTSCAFFSDESYSTLFDFSKPITTDINVYALFLNNQGNKETLSDLMQKNSNLAVYDQRRGGSGGSYDVISDPLYDTTTNTIFLKNTTIASGATTNFTFGESKVYLDPIEGTFNDSVSAHRTSTDTSISTEYSGTNYIGDDNCSLNIILTGDLTVNGTLNLGADIGGANDFTKFSYIKGMYAKIDLYGHNIYVDGGNLNAYGLIVDSVGTGKIIVKNNGSVKSTISVSDGRQINQVLVGLSKRQTPFSEYKFPYLQVPTYFYNGSTFSGYLKFELCRYGISNIIMNVVGPSNALFLWNDNVPENYVLFNPYRVEPISNLKDVNFLRQDYDLRNEFVFNANVKEIESLELTLEIEILTTVKGTLDFIRIDVPISTFFDLVLNDGFTMEISSKITFYPGSSFTVNKNATLKLTYRGSVKYDAQAMSYIPGEERYIAGGIMSYTNHIGEIANNGYSKNRFNIGIYNNEKFWNLTKTSNVNIYGNLIFDDTIDTTAKTGDGYYYLSGKINLSKNALDSIISNKNFIKTYDFKAELHSGLFIDSGHMGIEYLYEAATSYNCNCLISGDEAFVIDANKARKGSFDAKNGIFVKESDVDILNNEITYTNSTGEYFLCVDTDMYEDGSTGNDQSSRIDRNIVITEIKESNKSGRLIQTIDDKFYVYYCGLYIPVVSEMTEIINPSNGSTINANCRKFFSNNESDYAYASKYDSVILKYNSSSKIWAYSSFHE